MQNFLLTIVPIGLLGINIQTHAEISLDGTLGRSSALTGPEYLIGADFGKQHGSNLFHSFQKFNLQSHESATFSGPNHIQNVISRVTGGNPSSIDGLIRSTIPNADMYFLNPYGIMFGPNARLDVQGSFHASTADYLRLENGGRFDARHPNNSLLTVAPIEAFGFLNTPVAPISMQGYGEVTPDWENKSTGLSVPSGKTLSLIGGHLEMFKGTFFQSQNEETQLMPPTRLPILSAPHGRINLASVASQGEVRLGDAFIDVSSFTRLAEIRLIGNSLLQTSGEGGGSVFISGGKFEIINSALKSDTLGDKEGGMTYIQVDNLAIRASKQLSEISANTESTGKGGTININANQMLIEGGGLVRSTTRSSGHAGNISVEVTDHLKISGQNLVTGLPSLISVNTTSTKAGAGDGGNIEVAAGKISLIEGGSIYNLTFGPGNSGSIKISADTLTISGGFKKPWSRFEEFGLKFSPSMISAETASTGHAGNIDVTADKIILTDGGQINSNTYEKGNGGSLTIKATDYLTAKGKYVHGDNFFNSGLMSSSFSKLLHSGNAGHLSIKASNISLVDRSEISTFSQNAESGTIDIEANQILLKSGGLIESDTFSSGKGGDISIKVADSLNIVGQNTVKSGPFIGSPSAITASTNSKTEAGNGGNIEIKASKISLTDGGSILNWTLSPGDGGTITISTDTLTISGGFKKPWPEFAAYDMKILSSAISARTANTGNAGNIEVAANQIRLTDGGQINSNTYDKGNAGSITIKETDSLIAKGKYVYDDAFFLSGVMSSSFSELSQSGNAGHLSIKAKNISLTDRSEISTFAQNAKSGTINIEADQMMLKNGGLIESDTFGAGKGGNISVVVAETLDIVGQNTVTSGPFTGSPSAMTVSTNSKTEAADGGNIDIKAGHISLTEGGSIFNWTLGAGDSGTIIISTDTLTISGGLKKPWPEFAGSGMKLLPSAIFAQTTSTGHAGNIEVNANKIILTDGGQINSNTSGKGHGGSLTIKATDSLTAKGKYVGESIFKSGMTSRSSNQQPYSGNAGHIVLHAGNQLYMEGGAITTATERADGGNITITAPGFLYLINSDITTSVGAEKGNGGNITLSPSFIVQDSSKIIARAVGGNGGNIDITTTGIYKFLPKLKSPIDASSKFGVNGVVTVNTPDSSADEGLFALSTALFDASTLMDTPCGHQVASNLNRFWLKPSEGTANAVNDLLPSGPLLLPIGQQVTSHQQSKKTPFHQYLTVTGCRSKRL